MEKYLRVGVITSPHGVRGEVKVYPTTDDAMRFKKLDHVILDLGRGESRELKIRQVKFFKNMVILKFDGVDTMNEVEGWRQKDLLITRDQAVPLQEDEFFITDLIGLTVVTDEGDTLGTLTDGTVIEQISISDLCMTENLDLSLCLTVQSFFIALI